MKYLVAVLKKQNRAADFGNALGDGKKYKPAEVYVVGVDEAKALELALTDGLLEVQDMDARTLAQFSFSEVIGTEEQQGDVARLIEFAEMRARELARTRR
jgi:hypothetical protein